jgi:hypothetical protein
VRADGSGQRAGWPPKAVATRSDSIVGPQEISITAGYPLKLHGL